MKISEKLLCAFILAITVIIAPITHAAPTVTGTVVETLVADNSRWGGCMVRLNVPIGGGCAGDWVSFDCDGVLGTPKDLAHRGYDTAVMAAALGKQVSIWTQSNVTVSGFCYVNRIDVLLPAP